jgi:3-hydroxybutyryl-CoA dehydrogenase
MDRMGIVEVAVPEQARPVDLQAAEVLASTLRKRVVRVRDQAGFAASRMALAQGLEAMRLLEAGAATRDDLDALMASGYGHPMGPLELSDRIGLDLRLAIAERIHREGGQAAFEPPAILRRLVAEGFTGRSVGHGFYRWDDQGGKS